MDEIRPIKRHASKKETLADMTEPMQTALIHCASRGVTPEEFGPGCRWSTATRKALVKHELIHLVKTRKGYPLWRPTDTGRGLVATHIPSLLSARPDRVRFKTLPPRPGKKFGRHAVDETASGGDYTHRPSEAMRAEPEAA